MSVESATIILYNCLREIYSKSQDRKIPSWNELEESDRQAWDVFFTVLSNHGLSL